MFTLTVCRVIGIIMRHCLVLLERWVPSSSWNLVLADFSSLIHLLCSLACTHCGGHVSFCISSKRPGLCFSPYGFSWPFVHPLTLSSATSLEEWISTCLLHWMEQFPCALTNPVLASGLTTLGLQCTFCAFISLFHRTVLPWRVGFVAASSLAWGRVCYVGDRLS